MVGEFVFYVEDETLLENPQKGPTIRFTAKFGFVQKDVENGKNAEAYFVEMKGCVLRHSWGKFEWTPSMSMLYGKYWQYVKVTENIQQKILQCLEKRGACQKLLEAKDHYATLKPRKKQKKLNLDELMGQESKFLVEA